MSGARSVTRHNRRAFLVGAGAAAIPDSIERIMRPYLLRKGINPALQSAAEVLTRGTSQTSGAPLADTVFGNERRF